MSRPDIDPDAILQAVWDAHEEYQAAGKTSQLAWQRLRHQIRLALGDRERIGKPAMLGPNSISRASGYKRETISRMAPECRPEAGPPHPELVLERIWEARCACEGPDGTTRMKRGDLMKVIDAALAARAQLPVEDRRRALSFAVIARASGFTPRWIEKLDRKRGGYPYAGLPERRGPGRPRTLPAAPPGPRRKPGRPRKQQPGSNPQR